MKKLFVFSLAFVFVVAISSTANALLINEGESVVYAFDFTSATLPAPYQMTELQLYMDVVVNGGTNHASVVAYLPLPNVWDDEEPGYGAGFNSNITYHDWPYEIPNHVLSPTDKFLVNDIYTVRLFAEEGSFDIEHINLILLKQVGTAQDPSWFMIPKSGNPVPEPTTMLLFGAGLVGLAGFGRQKFKK